MAREIRIAPNEFGWPAEAGPGIGTSLMREVETMVLKGDPSKPGLYTILLRIAPNTKIQPHRHGDDRIRPSQHQALDGRALAVSYSSGYGGHGSTVAVWPWPDVLTAAGV